MHSHEQNTSARRLRPGRLFTVFVGSEPFSSGRVTGPILSTGRLYCRDVGLLSPAHTAMFRWLHRF